MRGIPELEEPLKAALAEHLQQQHKGRTKNSKNVSMPMSARPCASAAMTEPNLTQPSIIGPRKSDRKNSVMSTAAFHTVGPTAMSRIRTSGLGGVLPCSSGNDLTNMYATMKMMHAPMGHRISEKMTFLHGARGTSPDSFSDGCPSFFFLYPVIAVRDRRQYPYQLLAFVRELPRDIQRKNSR